jgi:TFIIF-interacting CTD phosphatase-like protein
MHPDNGIPIKSWYGTDDDDILAKLFNLLVKIKNEFSNDLREGIKHYFN